MKIKITEIIEWEEDNCLIAGDASRNGDKAVRDLIEAEREKKVENGIADRLPFVCEACNIDEALDKYNLYACECI